MLIALKKMSYNNLRSVPVYRKALELCIMSRELASYVSNKDLLHLYQSNSLRDIMADAILTDAILIPQQIARAESSNSLAVRRKSARFINIMTRNILSYCNGLEKDGVKEKEYLNLLRKEIRSFRRSFKKWRKSIGPAGSSGSWGFNDYLY
ncbi:hypothetical protein CLV82_2625 [Zeaxanthinibacter enoshimensis]|uniref:Four helix bundle protein n=2 Tax=Zeaxanthinibacter enoshimensis TaxID=392009 RepID=A0A4R6TLY8_9FLAO|nr:hypothetical protein CLV82_2625 [Zeaxanthinibacter enoshimensis]